MTLQQGGGSIIKALFLPQSTEACAVCTLKLGGSPIWGKQVMSSRGMGPVSRPPSTSNSCSKRAVGAGASGWVNGLALCGWQESSSSRQNAPPAPWGWRALLRSSRARPHLEVLQPAQLLGRDGPLDLVVGDVHLQPGTHRRGVGAGCWVVGCGRSCSAGAVAEVGRKLTLVMKPFPPRTSLASTVSPRQPAGRSMGPGSVAGCIEGCGGRHEQCTLQQPHSSTHRGAQSCPTSSCCRRDRSCHRGWSGRPMTATERGGAVGA